MAVGMQFKMIGAEQIIDAFGRVADGMKRRVLKNAVDKSVQVFVPPFRKVTPKSKPGSKSKKEATKNPSGTMRKSTGKIIRKYKGGALVAGYAGHRWPKGAAAHLVFGGTTDRFRKNVRRGYSGFVRKNPALRQAYEQNKSRSSEVLRSELEHGVDNEVAKAAMRTLKKIPGI
jgi:hypothetical protein